MIVNEQDLQKVLRASLSYTNEQLKTSMDYTYKAIESLHYDKVYNNIVDLALEIKFINAVLIQLGYTTKEIKDAYIAESKILNANLYIKEEKDS